MRFAACAALLVPIFAAAARAGEEPTFSTTKRQLIGVFPAVSAEVLGDPKSGAREAFVHLQFALTISAKCLELPSGSTHLVEATAIAVEHGGETIRFEFSREPLEVAVLLLSPERAPLEVLASAGPSSLQVLVPDAAADFFDAPGCRQDP